MNRRSLFKKLLGGLFSAVCASLICKCVKTKIVYASTDGVRDLMVDITDVDHSFLIESITLHEPISKQYWNGSTQGVA